MKEKNIVLDDTHYFKSPTKTEEHKANISKSLKGKTRTLEHKKALSESARNRKPSVVCEHCGKLLLPCHYSLHHGEKCKLFLTEQISS